MPNAPDRRIRSSWEEEKNHPEPECYHTFRKMCGHAEFIVTAARQKATISAIAEQD